MAQETTGTPETVTDDDVAAAEAAADDAQALVAELEERVANGDESVTEDDIVAQESLGRFARRRVEATRRKAAAAKAAARLRECEALAKEIEGYTSGSGEHFASLLQAVQDAREAFTAALTAHNEKLGGWAVRAAALGVGVHDGRPVPPAEDGRLALGRGAEILRAGRRQLYTVDSKHYLALVDSSDAGAAVANLRSIDAPTPEDTATHFYRGENGQVICRDRPYSDEELTYVNVTAISRAEAWGE
jgi:hypothetical protein